MCSVSLNLSFVAIFSQSYWVSFGTLVQFVYKTRRKCQQSIFRVRIGPIWSVNNVVFILLELQKRVLLQQTFLVVVVLFLLVCLKTAAALVAMDDHVDVIPIR